MRITVARSVRDGRRAIGWSQQELGRRARVSRQMIGRVERATVTPSFEVSGRLFGALGVEAELLVRVPFLVDRQRQRDPAHARCTAYVQRRLEKTGWIIRREVEVVQGRSHGWIDVLAFDPGAGTLLVIEIKTQLDDLGRIERSPGWYEREAVAAARRLGWRARRIRGWLLLLATAAADDRVIENREALGASFPGRAPAMIAWLRGSSLSAPDGRAFAMIDPRNRRRAWLIRTRIDGRRTPAPYRDYADFMAALRRPL
ncbi:MAG: helix-turn-helix transcriptional regulator [Chloroflexota bacterium]|nr:helix-turn-helix transcriptional regulator [Chloroflexota bacterium]